MPRRQPSPRGTRGSTRLASRQARRQRMRKLVEIGPAKWAVLHLESPGLIVNEVLPEEEDLVAWPT